VRSDRRHAADLEGRSIVIAMRRRLDTEPVERPPRDLDAYLDLRRKCARWAVDHMEALKSTRPEIPDDLRGDRVRDSWEPLLAIAEACGPDWAETARETAAHLAKLNKSNEPLPIQLLRDLRTLFEREHCAEDEVGLSSQEIVTALAEMEERPWPEYSRGKPITPRGVAKLLKGFGIFPRQVLPGTGKKNGYTPDRFKSVFARYLGKKPIPRPPDGSLF
jgi:putative DNA primase/helicase